MEPKRELTSVDLAALVTELRAYRGAGVDKVYLYPDDLVRFRLRHFEAGRLELLVHVGDTKHVRLADPDRVPDAPERPPDFAMMLRNRLAGTELTAVEQHGFDRILTLRFEREADSTAVVAELFGDGNVAVLDAAGEVVDSLETVRLKSRTVAPGSPYEYPEAPLDPLSADAEAFGAALRDSDTDVVRTLATQLGFGGLWAEELCTRAEVPKTRAIPEATDAEVAAVHRAVDDLADRLTSGDLDPRVYFGEPEGDHDERGPRVDVTPVSMAEYADLDAVGFDAFTAALEDYFTNFEADHEERTATRERPDFEEQIERKKRIVEQQRSAIEDFEAESEALRASAEALYAHYDLVDEVLATVREARAAETPWSEIEERFAEGAERGIPAAEAVDTVDGAAGTVTMTVGDHRVTLDADTGVEKNADRLYREAKGVEDKQAGAEAAIEDTREELADLEARRAEWTAEEDAEPATTEADETEAPVDWLARESIPVRRTEQWYERFRWFHTSDGFLVIGGRDADDNEELVAKYLETGDRFFHAQAHGGPATVLKATGPSEATSADITIPERSREEAAQFAVSYSSVWKDGRFAGDVYEVGPDQVTKTPESGEYLEKGGFAIRGERTYFEDVPVGVAVGITCEEETRVVGGPPDPIRARAETAVCLEPGRFAQNDAAKKVYRELRDRFADESFVRKVASPDLIQEFLPPGGSRIVEE